MVERPKIVKKMVDAVCEELIAGRRMSPCVFFGSGSNLSRIVFSNHTVRSIRKTIVAKVLRKRCDEICLAFEGTVNHEPDEVDASIACSTRPTHKAGVVVILWESAGGGSRMWINHIAWPSPTTILSDGFREVFDHNGKPISGNLAGFFEEMREVVASC